MTRTQWLLVTVIALLVWAIGWVAQIPALGIVGLLATITGVAGAAFTKTPSSPRRG